MLLKFSLFINSLIFLVFNLNQKIHLSSVCLVEISFKNAIILCHIKIYIHLNR